MKLAISKVKKKKKKKQTILLSCFLCTKTWVFARTKNKRNENKIKTSVSN